jgi:hypothetical protein
MLRYGRQVALAIEFDPEWVLLDNLAVSSVHRELINLSNSVLHHFQTRNAKERVLYFIDWRIRPLDGISVAQLGAPPYEGRGVKFYEVIEWASRLRQFQTASHSNQFEYPGHDILSLIRYISFPGHLQGHRHITFRVLATIRT